MISAPAIGVRLARLLLLAFTVLGVAALHTIGHAAIAGPADQHHAAAVAGLAMVAAPSPADPDGCAGDGCTHPAAAPGSGESGRWWETCLAILGTLVLGALAAAVRGRDRTGDPGRSPTAPRRSPPSPTASPGLGLALATGAVLRT